MKDTTVLEDGISDATSPKGFWGRMKDAWRASEEYVAPQTEQTDIAETDTNESGFMMRREGYPYAGEISIFAGNYAPAGWAFCHGQLLQIMEYEALYSLLGTTYGGDGQSTFALPDLRGRIPIHHGTGPGLPTRVIGETGGAEAVTLTTNHLPAHSHSMVTGVVRGTGTQGAGLTSGTELGTLTAPTSTNTGGGASHQNMPPFLGLNFIISLEGTYPYT